MKPEQLAEKEHNIIRHAKAIVKDVRPASSDETQRSISERQNL